MRIEDLHLFSLLEFHPLEGKIFCEDERMLVFTASSLGALQRLLLEQWGFVGAKRILSRFGFNHGFHSCLTAQQLFGKNHHEDVAVRFHEVVGSGKYVNVTSVEEPSFRYHSDYMGSVEVEQYVSRLGISDAPVCWWVSGFASGYCSAHFDTEIYYKELRCAAQGNTACEVVGLSAEQWGDELTDLRELYGFRNTCAAREFREREYELHRKWHLERTRARGLCGRAPLHKQNSLRERLVEITEGSGFVVREQGMWEALEHALAVAKLDTPVLVHGETGTGKEFVVNLIHRQSARANRALVSINCAALTETLLESELFGHTKGAFTGAVANKLGLFEVASNSSLFLDEIGDMPLTVQAKLLRVLENGELRRLGSTQLVRVSPRILAATHRDLQTLVAKGKFRADLYYRLNSLTIDLLPLRLRRESIPALIQLFLQELTRKFDKQIDSISPEAMVALVAHGWPGNVRELKHAIERAIVVAQDTVITVSDLPQDITRHKTNPLDSRRSNSNHLGLKEGERQAIADALAQYGGNRSATARALDIDVSTLWRKMRRYRLS